MEREREIEKRASLPLLFFIFWYFIFGLLCIALGQGLGCLFPCRVHIAFFFLKLLSPIHHSDFHSFLSWFKMHVGFIFNTVRMTGCA